MLQMVKLGRILDHFGSKAVQMCQMINSSPIFCKWTLSFLLLGLLTAFVVRFHSKTASHSAKLLARGPLASDLHHWTTLPFGIASELSQQPLGPLALAAPKAPCARAARARPCAREARAPRRRARSARVRPWVPPRVPGARPGLQGIATTALRINCAASKLRCEKAAREPNKGRR